MSDASSRNRVKVRIAGEELVLRSTAEPDYAERCARYLDGRVTEVSRTGGLPPSRALILAALSITDGYFSAQEELERLRREVASRASNLAHRVEEVLDRS